MGLLFREHPKAQPEGGFRRSPGSNLRPLVYKASDLTTAPRRLLIEFFGIYKMFKMLNHSDVQWYILFMSNFIAIWC